MELLSVVLPALAVVVILLMLVEARQWRAGRRLISRRQLVLRMTGGVALLGLLTAIFLGLYLLNLRVPGPRPLLFFAWWGGCLVAAVALVYLALADIHHVEQRQLEREHDLWREIARTLAERIRQERAERPNAGDKPT